MSNWQIFVQTSNYGWASDDAIPRPNSDMETETNSTQQVVKLADGSTGFVLPEVGRSKEPFSMFFANTTTAFRSQIDTYINNGDKVKIETHTGEIFIGRFINWKRVWFSGIEPDLFDLNVTFMPTE